MEFYEIVGTAPPHGRYRIDINVFVRFDVEVRGMEFVRRSLGNVQGVPLGRRVLARLALRNQYVFRLILIFHKPFRNHYF